MSRKKKNKAQARVVEENIFLNEEKISNIINSSEPKVELSKLLSNHDKDFILEVFYQYLSHHTSFNKEFEPLLAEINFKSYRLAIKEALAFTQKERFSFLKGKYYFVLSELVGEYFRKSPLDKEFEGLVSKQSSELLIKAIRTNRAFMDKDRLAFYSQNENLKIPAEHLEIWKYLNETEDVLWKNVGKCFADFYSENKKLQSVNEQFCAAMIEITVWMEEKRWKETGEIRGLLQECYNLFVEKYCRDCEITILDFTERSAEDELIKQWKYIIEKQNSEAANDLFEAIFSWIVFKNSILDPYCYDMTFNPRTGKNGTLYLSQSPKDYYRWILDGLRYEINRNDYSFKGGDITDAFHDIRINNDEMNLAASDKMFSTKLLLEDLCLDKIWKDKDVEISNIFMPLIGLSTNRLYRYEKPLEELKTREPQGIGWKEAYSLLFYEHAKQDVKVLPFNIYTTDMFLQQTKDAGFPEDTVNLATDLFNLFCFKFNKEKFDRFKKRSYDVMSKPFLKIGVNTYFTPTMFLANNDWFYGSAEKVMEKYSKADEKTRKDNSAQMELKLTELFRANGWKTECHHDGDKNIKGDVDIIVEGNNTAILIQLKRTIFRTNPSEQYLEIENVDNKAAYQLNAYQYNGSKKNVVRWYVTNSYENCLKEFVSENGAKCTKVNYFDLIRLLENNKNLNSLDELIEYVTDDLSIKELYLDLKKRPCLSHAGMIMPIIPPDRAYEILIKTDDTETQEKLNGVVDKSKKCIDERMRISLELSETTPDDYVIWDILADIYKDKEEFGKAIECCKKALEILPDDPFLLHNYAVTLRKEREFHQPLLILPQSKEELDVVKNLWEHYWFLNLEIQPIY